MGDAGTKSNSLFPPRNPITKEQISAALSVALDLQNKAITEHDKRPFTGVLLAPDNTTVLMSHYSISHIRHAETQLARLASDHYPQPYLWQCTLVSTWEPCAMCSGNIYWSNIGRLVYGAKESELRKLTGMGNEENLTLSLQCRELFAHGQKDIEVIGPVEGWEEKVVEGARAWWEAHRPT